MNSAAFIFPAVKGLQAQREYYVSMVPLDVMTRIFQFADDELPPEMRAQRVLNRARIPEIRDYILSNPANYVFSSLTVSVDGDMAFQALSDESPQIGTINISMASRFLINDGQHRRAAIAEALKINPALKKEHISVVFYQDEGLLRSQQMFSDLNRYAIKPAKSINILFNSREESSIIAKRVIEEVYVFQGLVEKERTAISNRSKALFTLSAICTATTELLEGVNISLQEKTELAKNYWNAVGRHIIEWNKVKNGEMKSADVRKNYICSLSITLVALGYAGNAIIQSASDTWEERLKNLSDIDWRKTNPEWENLVFVNGRVAANRSTQKAMSNHIRNILIETAGDKNGKSK
ncbi:MAG: DNA sulfur modification protein DndB [Lachnospiraceae bacterium]|nr:DNA sulfur modification protein DndB [Lachnospiraceae bacterium]